MAPKKEKQSFPVLSENEKKLLEVVTKGSVVEARLLLSEKDVKVDCLDDSGMTPLQHAAFRGKVDVSNLLLQHGANVNSNFHENGYTALMFAALSGNPDVTRLMLQHGAKKDHVNTVGRNATQMAAFVGQHQCVAVINNYYDKEDLKYYTIPRGQETEPKLPPSVLPALLELLNSANMHPVKISLHAQVYPGLMNESYKVCKVLDLICEKAMKARDTDDVMAMKAHYFATVIRKAKNDTSLETWIKKLLRGREIDGYPEFQDQVIRQALKEFPYVESQLLQNMVRQLSATKIGDHPTSLNILNQGVNGHKFGFDETKECSACGEQTEVKKCSACKMAHYCSPNCQKLHWFTHKKFCKKLAEEYVRLEKMNEEAKKLEEERKIEEEKQKEKEKQTNGEAPDKQAKGDAGSKQNTEVTEEQSSTSEAGSQEHYPDPTGMGSGEDLDVPDIDYFLRDPEIIKAFQDREIQKALEEVSEDPSNIKKYENNEKLMDIVHAIPNKLAEFIARGKKKAADAEKSRDTTAGESVKS